MANAGIMLNPKDIAERGRAIYESRLRATIEPNHRGEYVVVDVESGDYSLAPDEELALEQIEQLRPNGLYYMIRVGYAASLFLGKSS